MSLATLFVTVRPSTVGFDSALGRGLRGVRAPGEAGKAAGDSYATHFKASIKGLGSALGQLAGITAAFEIGKFAKDAVTSAGDFQKSMNLLVTAGGESTKALSTVSGGIKKIAVETGTSTKDLAEGMYTVEKASFRGADGLKVLKAAAQAAADEQVHLSVLTGGLTSIMRSYNIPASGVVKITNELVAASGRAKSTMSEYAGSLSTVLPIAASAKISFVDVAAAIATLTSHGTTAQEATQHLAFTIRGLLNPNLQAQKMMANFGLSATDLSKNLGKRGLSGTIDLVSEAILKKMGPNGLVLINAFNQSKDAARDATTEFGKLSPAAQKLATEFMNGGTSAGGFSKSVSSNLKGMDSVLASSWLTAYRRANGFNDVLKQGGAQSKTYEAALAKITGGSAGLTTALQLTGNSADYLKESIKVIGDAGKKTGDNIAVWGQTQKTFNIQLSRFKESVQVAAINVGEKLLPILTTLFRFGTDHLIPWLGDLAKKVGPVLSGAFHVLGGFISDFIGGFKSTQTVDAFGGHLNDAAKSGIQVRDMAKKVLDTLKDLYAWFTDKILPKLNDFKQGMIDGTGAGGDFVGIIKLIGSTILGIAGFITDHTNLVLAVVGAYAAVNLAAKGITFVNDTKKAIGDTAKLFTDFGKSVGGLAGKIGGGAKSFVGPGGGLDGIRLVFMGAGDAAKTFGANAKAGISLWADAFKGNVKTAAGAAKSFGSDAKAGVKLWGDSIASTAGAAASAVKDFGGKAADGIKTFGGHLKDLAGSAAEAALQMGKAAAQAVWAGIQAAAAAIKTVALKLAQLAVAAATKIWAGIQVILDAAMDANPISIIILVIAALVVGIIYAYKHSQTFRDIVHAALHAVGDAATWMWEKAIKPALDWVVKAAETTWKAFGTFRDFVGSAIAKAQSFIKIGALAIVSQFADLAYKIVSAADSAFGWIPGLGPKLDTAKNDLRTFRDNANRAIGQIKDGNVKINVDAKGTIAAIGGFSVQDLLSHGLAAGGPVHGAGNGTIDTVPTMLANNEHVWTAREVANAGGHGAMKAMRAQYAYANGGAVGLPSSKLFYNSGNIEKDHTERTDMARAAKLTASALKAYAAMGDIGGSGGSGGPYGDVGAIGSWGNIRTWVIDHLGIPYLFGGNGPLLDCSSFTQQALRAGGINVPRIASAQQAVSRAIGPSALAAGDLGFVGNPAEHVGIYMGGGRWAAEHHTGTVSSINGGDGWNNYGRVGTIKKMDGGGDLGRGFHAIYHGQSKPDSVVTDAFRNEVTGKLDAIQRNGVTLHYDNATINTIDAEAFFAKQERDLSDLNAVSQTSTIGRV